MAVGQGGDSVTVLLGRCPICGETNRPLVMQTSKGIAHWACIDCVEVIGHGEGGVQH